MRSRILVVLFVLLSSVATGLISLAQAQEVQRIAAIVNDEVISLYDLVSRTRLALLTTGLPDTPENRRRMQPQVLRALIDERIQAQEAARQNITVSDADMADAIRRVEENNRMQRGGLEALIRDLGAERSAILSQIRAGVMWQKLVNRKLRSSLQVGEDEIDEQVALLKSAQGTAEYLLAEIFLAVDTPDQEDEIRQAAMGIAEQVRRGAPFASVARQFSQSASAAAGGDIGWVRQGTLEQQVEAVVEAMQPGQMTEPLRSVGGYYIYALRNRRTVAGASPEETKVAIRQMLIPLERSAAAAEVESHEQLAQAVRDSVSGCDDLERVAKEMGVPPPTQPQQLRLGELAPRIREAVTPLKVGEASAPIKIDQGLLMLMLCSREEPPSNLPSRDDIAEGLLRQRLDLAARRYLRDLRRAAFVDVRV
jgi:peptidyl-prolyl cis-trans isomerase SurA